MTENDENRRAKIAELNDQDRKDVGLPNSHFQATNPHRVVMTAGIAALPLEDQIAICRKVHEFNAFGKDNDPHGEHDFGIVKHRGESVYWKIDYYDRALEYGSEVPADRERRPAACWRSSWPASIDHRHDRPAREGRGDFAAR